MAYDVAIRNGTVIDGSGMARFRADVAIVGDRIVQIGRIDERATAEIDAEGHIVSPGFIDGHTHMDAQVFWDTLGTNSCWHGVTSVVMGNCGFTLAPSRQGEHNLVLDNLVRAEDIPASAMAEGISWNWESFPEYLDAVDDTPKAINYAAQIGHSALRTFVMGERAFSDVASEDDVKLMEYTLREALRHGAVGFSTSVSDHHSTPQGRPVASRMSSWHEISRLVDVMGAEGAGVFEIALDTELVESDEVTRAKIFYDRLRDLAIATRVPITFGLRNQHLQTQLDTFDGTAAAGGRMFGQCRSNLSSNVYCFKSNLPLDRIAEWKAFRSASLESQRAALQDVAVRQRLVEAASSAYREDEVSGRRTLPSFDRLKVMREGHRDQSLSEIAKERGASAIDVMIDLALESDFEQVFGLYNGEDGDAELLSAMKHPRTIMTFSDSGAHVSLQSGAELQTTLLAEWVRKREEFTLEEAVRMLTLAPALAWRIPNRGLLREGMVADINIFDPNAIAPGVPRLVNDLPAGAPRFEQKASGIRSTIVSGVEVFRAGVHTGTLPGALLRGHLAYR